MLETSEAINILLSVSTYLVYFSCFLFVCLFTLSSSVTLTILLFLFFVRTKGEHEFVCICSKKLVCYLKLS